MMLSVHCLQSIPIMLDESRLTATACVVQSCAVSCYECRVRSSWENLDPSVHFDRDDIASRSNDCCTSINILKTLYSLSLSFIYQKHVCLSVCLNLHSPTLSLSLSSPFFVFLLYFLLFISFSSKNNPPINNLRLSRHIIRIRTSQKTH